MRLTFTEIDEYIDLLYSLSIRGIVFIKEQNCSFAEEYDKFDMLSNPNVSHIIGKNFVDPVATGRIIYCENKIAKLERISVLEQYRGLDIGKNLLEFMVKLAMSKEYYNIYIHAQVHLQQFYEDLNFIAEGQIFQEANISHIKMIYSHKVL